MPLSPLEMEIKIADLKSENLKLSAKIDYICLMTGIDMPIESKGDSNEMVRDNL